MKKFKGQNYSTKAAIFAGAAALMALTPQSHAQTSVDALLNKLEQKGILSVDEARELRAENATNSVDDFNKALTSKFPMPDWVTGYRLYGDFRGRYDELTTDSPGNPTTFLSGQNRVRLRYRLRVGLTIDMKDNLEAGFRLGSGDAGGGALSNNTTLENNGTKKPVWVDAAFGKWSPLHKDPWMLALTVGKMDQPFQASPMVFDPDYTPEGAALQSSYKINDNHSLVFNGAAFVLDELPGSARDPFLYGGQLIWNANWTSKLATSLGVAAYDIVNGEALGLANGLPNPNPSINPGGVPDNNQGNSRDLNGNLIYNYNPFVISGSVIYTLDSFPLYHGKFPIKFSGEYMQNPAASANNEGWWGGITLGKSGKKGLWDISYRYERLGADAWYDELVDDDNVAFYANVPSAYPSGKTGWLGGTNIRGHLIKFNYSITDALTFSFTAYINDLISPGLDSTLGEPQNNAIHAMADLIWKF